MSTCEGWTVTMTTGTMIVGGVSTVVAHLVSQLIAAIQVDIKTAYALMEMWTFKLPLVGS